MCNVYFTRFCWCQLNFLVLQPPEILHLTLTFTIYLMICCTIRQVAGKAKCQRGTPALHLNEAADGSCCDAGLGLVWHCYWIYMSFISLIPKKNICFGFFKGRGCVESKNRTSAKRKSTMSSLDPSIIQVDSFKCRVDVPLWRITLFLETPCM